MTPFRPSAAAALALLLAACGTAPVAEAPWPPGMDFRGTWTGTWGGRPLTLLVTEQVELPPRSGLHVGPIPLGPREPGVTGVLTFAARGTSVSAGFRGWIRASARTASLVLEAVTPDGSLELALREAGADRLTGTGGASFRWGPAGDVELTRRAPAPR